MKNIISKGNHKHHSAKIFVQPILTISNEQKMPNNIKNTTDITSFKMQRNLVLSLCR